MKVHATLDFIDGAKSKQKTVYLDEVDSTFLLMHLTQPGVASITFTRADVLQLLMKHMIDGKETKPCTPPTSS